MNTRQVLYACRKRTQSFLEFLFYQVFDRMVLAAIGRRARAPGLAAVVQLQLLGDYFVWLPYGDALIKRLQAQGRRVVLVGNAQWASLACEHFGNCQRIVIAHKRFMRDLGYRARLLRRLRELAPEIVINVGFPRIGTYEDAAVRALGGEATGLDLPDVNRARLDCRISRHLYRTLVPPRADPHRTARNWQLAKALGIERSAITPFSVGMYRPPSTPWPDFGAPYFLIAPGASDSARRWPVERFAELARRVVALRPDWLCVLTGSAQERGLADEMQRLSGVRTSNLAGQLELPQLVHLFKNAQLVLCNDSAAGNIAPACGTPCVVALSGANFGNCQPYDASQSFVTVVPRVAFHRMDCFGCGGNCRYRVKRGEPAPCVAAIDVECVWRQVLPLLADGDPPRITSSTPP